MTESESECYKKRQRVIENGEKLELDGDSGTPKTGRREPQPLETIFPLFFPSVLLQSEEALQSLSVL